MYTSMIILSPLSAGALALPAITNSTLQARHHDSNPNFGAYNDVGCASLFDKTHDVISSNCVAFAPGTDNVGINWGTDGWLAMNELDYFTDSECTKFAGRTIVAPPQESDYDGSGANTCISVKGHGAQWGSVRQHLD